jgi:hypothetical protein
VWRWQMAVPSLVNTHFTIANDHKLVIMVASSVAANDIMKKNRLSFTQLLQPYGAEFYKMPGMQGTHADAAHIVPS